MDSYIFITVIVIDGAWSFLSPFLQLMAVIKRIIVLIIITAAYPLDMSHLDAATSNARTAAETAAAEHRTAKLVS